MRLRRLGLVLGFLLAIPVPAPATTGVDAALLDRVAHRARGLDAGRLSASIATAGAMRGIEPAQVTPGAASLDPAVPAALAVPVARLTAGIEAARSAVARAVPAGADQARAWDLLRISQTTDPRTVEGQNAARDLERLAARVDVALLYGGALALAQAIEGAIPMLRGVRVPAMAGSVTGCDVVDTEMLCIAGEGDNVIKGDRPLVIDLGGRDLHGHRAGTALGAYGANGLPVSVTIDLGGSDVYTSSDAGQGAGATGIGMVVDLDGDDSYSVVGPSAAGQGFGSLGVGILADVSGSDSYEMTATGIGGSSSGPTVTGQGFGFVGSLGLALDGGGDDEWLMNARVLPSITDDDVVHIGAGTVFGHGFGAAGGFGGVADAGGSDLISMIVDADEPLPAYAVGSSEQPGFASVSGGGYGLVGGVGVSVRGPGDTIYEALAETVGPAVSTAWLQVFGWAQQGSVGLLLDRGGNDSYRGRAHAQAVASGVPQEGCCDPVRATATTSDITSSIVNGFGWGLLHAAAALIDEGDGDDTYAMASVSRAIAIADDDRTDLGAGSTAASAHAATGEAHAMGLGYGNGGGIGVVSDAGGDDTYRTQVQSDAEARAAAFDPNVSTEATSFAGIAFSFAQAVGVLGGNGELRDLGGSDAYLALAESAARTTPDGGAEVAPGTRGYVQGAGVFGGTSRLVDLDAGGTDIFESEPFRAPCAGERGGAAWVDCGDDDGAAGGLNP